MGGQSDVPRSLRLLVTAIFLVAFAFWVWRWYRAEMPRAPSLPGLPTAKPQPATTTPAKPQPAIVTPAKPQSDTTKSAKPRATRERINPKDGAVMVYIPAGEFIMGSDDGDKDEQPRRRVYLDGFWIYKQEVTVAQYRKFCQATKRKMPDAPPWGWKLDHPMVNVSWDDAKAYCDWAGVRLPTEAEWEKAARGTDGRKYPWGNEWDKNKCNNADTGLERTTPVGSYPQGASPYGALDMAGNVWEWCADWYDKHYYVNAPDRNPKGPASGEVHVPRGGSWYDPGTPCAYRLWLVPALYAGIVGFRCARTP